MNLTFRGSRSLRFAPVGVNNDMRLASDWPDPVSKARSCHGAGSQAGGFSAHCRCPITAVPIRSNGQRGTPSNRPPSRSPVRSRSARRGGFLPVRGTLHQYGILLIALLFTCFFLFEVMAAVRIHPFQYTLVGIALCLFYLALLALSEVVSFGAAYWTGAAASTLMISLTAQAVARREPRRIRGDGVARYCTRSSS